MSDQFVGEIRPVPYNFAPTGWALCQGQLIPIAQNTALFSLLGTYYGGDGRSTFALPNLSDNVPIGQGGGPGLTPRVLGETGGSRSVALLQTQIPAHNHPLVASSNPATSTVALGHALAQSARPIYSTNTPNAVMDPIGVTGGGQPHNNMMPYLTITYIIALQGIFPPRG